MELKLEGSNPLKNLTRQQKVILLIVALLAAAIPLILYLVQKQQTLQSKAGGYISQPISGPITPILTISASAPPQVTGVTIASNGFKVNLTASCQPAINRKIKGAVFHFGDNSPDFTVQYISAGLGMAVNVNSYHTYPSTGSYHATIRCIDDGDYLSATYPVPIILTNPEASPSATVSPTPSQGVPTLTVTPTLQKKVTKISVGNSDISLAGQGSTLDLSQYPANGNLYYLPVSITYSDSSISVYTIAFNYLISPTISETQTPISPTPNQPSCPTGFQLIYNGNFFSCVPQQISPISTPSGIPITDIPVITITNTPTPSQGSEKQYPSAITAFVDGVETPFVNNQVSLHLNGTEGQPADFYISVLAKYGDLPLKTITTFPVKIKYQPKQTPQTTLNISPDPSQLVNGQTVTLNFTSSYLGGSVSVIHTSIWPGISSEGDKNKVQPQYQGFSGSSGNRQAIVPFYVEYLAQAADGTQEQTKKMLLLANPKAKNIPHVISSNCSNGMVNLSWSGQFDHYWLRVDNLADGWDGSCFSPSGDFCNNQLKGNSTQFNVKGGQYQWWIHGVNSSGPASEASERGTFSCNLSNTSTAPTNLSASCQNNTARFSWSEVSGTERYLIRIDDTSNGWGGYNSQPGDIIDDNILQNSYTTHSIQSGHNYSWWVHSIDSLGKLSDASDKSNFSCP